MSLQPSLVAIPTARRPASLRRALRSFARHFAQSGRSAPIAVFHSPHNQREQDEVKAEALAASARYVGLDEKVKLARALRKASGAPMALFELALFNPSKHPLATGANRNACLLASAGRRALHADDDLLAALSCHPRFDPLTPPALEPLAGEACDFFVPSADGLARFALAADDARAPAGGLLGALESAWDAAARAGLRSPLAFFGIAGDCGWGAPFGFWGESLGYLLLPDESLRRLAADGVTWRETLERRRLLRVADRLRASRGATGMTTCVGVDGTQPLPPFFPVGRGQDALFSAMAERFGGFASLQVPFAVAHEPLEARRFSAGELLRSAGSLDLSRALFAFLETLPAHADLAGFGEHLGALGALETARFEEALRAAHQQRMARLLASARARAAQLGPQLSPEWRDDLEAYCAAVERPLRAREPLWILDAGGGDAGASLERFRALTRGFGQLCEAWPAIWKSAQALPLAGEPQNVNANSHSHFPGDAPAAASPYQGWLWKLHQLEPDDTSYVLFRAFAGAGPLHEALLEQALRALAARHELLRSRFQGGPGEEAQLVPLPLEQIKVRKLGPLDEPARSAARRAEPRRPFELTREAPFELTLVRAAEAKERFELWLRIDHIAWDGVSESIFWRELEAIYRNLLEGRAADAGLPPAGSFRAIAARQRKLPGAARVAAERHWKALLRDLPPELRLSSRAPPAARSPESHRLRLVLPAATSEALIALAQSRKTTVAALGLAAWQALLARFSGERDIAVAVNFANRWDPEEERQIGLFMTVLPTRANLGAAGAEPSLLELAERNQRALAEGFAHARLPLDQLVSAVTNTGRRRFALFQALFTHLTKVRAPAPGGLQLKELERRETQSGAELGLTLESGDAGLAAVLVGNQALFSADDLRRLGEALASALGSIAAKPALADAPFPSLDWLGADRARIAAWNRTEASYPRDSALAPLLRAQAEKHPERVALLAGAEAITNAELFARSAALAARLKRAGVSRDVRVGVYFDRHPRLLEALLAVLEAGGGYLPLDPNFPQERLAFMLEDSGAPVIVTRRGLFGDLPPHRARVLCVDDPAASASEGSDETRAGPDELRASEAAGWQPATAESLAYVLYTSGSTGKPKGVEIPHRAIVNFLCSMAREPGLHAGDTLLALTTVSFDIAALELWLPLLVGARIALGGREEAADGSKLRALLESSSATALQTTPATWRALYAAGFPGDATLTALVGGEALPPDLAEKLASTCGEAWNLYGPTETTVWSAAWRLPQRGAGAVRIGRPIANTVIRILDDARRELPIGVTGEITIGGDGVARGYLNRPELTAERFVADPYGPPGARLYRTGDRGRWLPEGQLECLGRNDDQIKLRGFRMEPGEIEAALLQQPEIEHAAVALHEVSPGEPRLVAWLVLKPEMKLPPAQELRARLRGFLLEHMLPYHFVEVAALPLTPNGKVNRRALGPLFRAPAGEAPAREEPPSPEEALVLAKFAELLGRPAGLDSDFFESGGDSLSALRLIGMFGETHPIAPTTGELFLHSTPRLLARLLRELQQRPRGKGHLVPLRKGGPLPPLFLLHPIGGQLAAYGQLVLHLSGQAPLFGLLAASAGERRYASLAERCSAYVEEILEAAPGPVALAGYSLGGTLALECASQLAARGREVRLVAMFDSWVPRPSRRSIDKALFRARELWRYSWSERLRWGGYQLARRFGPADPPEEPLAGLDPRAMEELGRQSLAWTPPRYAGPVRLFRAELDLRGNTNRPGTLGWGRSCSQLEVTDLRCDHTQMMREPHAAEIAQRILGDLGGK